MAKIKSLTHNGPVFPEEWAGFPAKVKAMTPFIAALSPLAEEMFFHYAAKRDTDYVKDAVFNKNFFKCFVKELPAQYKKINFPADLKKDIDVIFKWNEERKEAKKAYNKEHKEEIKAAKEAQKKQYGTAMLNGKEQPLGSYMIEGPGIMIARGNSPIRGLWKYRVQPEDVVINYIGPKANAPKAPAGHKWKAVEANTNNFAIALYKVNCGDVKASRKAMMFGTTSDVKVGADQKKFKKALELIKNWDSVEDYIQQGLASKDKKVRECAAIAWLIQNTAIRVGNERDEETQSTEVVGASTLKVSNITIA